METVIFIIIPSVLVFVVSVAIMIIINQNRAKRAYLKSLEKLKRDPHNPNLREKTLALGREYARLVRPMNGVAIFDEVALMNDINAACARAGSKVRIVEDEREPSIEARLKKLERLRSKELITEKEYQSRRQQILDDL